MPNRLAQETSPYLLQHADSPVDWHPGVWRTRCRAFWMCRYSVDERWAIPHFEKMLYDKGPLLGLFADAEPQNARCNCSTRNLRSKRSPPGCVRGLNACRR